MSNFRFLLKFLNSSIIDRYGYHIGLGALFSHIAVLFLMHALSIKPPVLLIFALQMLGVFILGSVITMKFSKVLLKNRKSRLLRWTIGIANTLLVGTLSVVWSKEIINAVTGTDPSHFTISMKLFPILLAPAAWVMWIGFAGFIYALALLMKLNILSAAGICTGGLVKVPPFLPSMGKVFGGASLGIIAVIFFTVLSPQTKLLENLLVNLDYVEKSECSNRQPGELIKDLHNGYISVAVVQSKGSYHFETRPCQMIIK